MTNHDLVKDRDEYTINIQTLAKEMDSQRQQFKSQTTILQMPYHGDKNTMATDFLSQISSASRLRENQQPQLAGN